MGNEEIRIPPQNVAAEKAVLGAMLIDEDAIGSVLERRLDSSFFYGPAHQRIFEGIKSLYNDRRQVDLITLSDRLKSDFSVREKNDGKRTAGPYAYRLTGPEVPPADLLEK